MNTKKDPWALPTFQLYEDKVNPNPVYQRLKVWDLKQNQMLIDSIIRGIDIPKIYLRKKDNGRFKYEIIDGQQRMKAIWDFLNNEYPLDSKAKSVIFDEKQYEIANKYYEDFDTTFQVEKFHRYSLDIIEILDATDDEISDLFYRLNNGTPLSPAEIRNAKPGKIKHFIKTIASKNPFFKKVSFKNKRFAYDQVTAQMMLLEINKGFADTRNKPLLQMYKDYKDNVPTTALNNMIKVLKILNNTFSDKSKFLNRAQTINVYLLISFLIKNYHIDKSFYPKYFDWYISTEPKRQKSNEYKLLMTSSANSWTAIDGRFKILLYDLYKKFKDIIDVELDPQRFFTEEQKQEIYGKYKGRCQGKTCGGKKVSEKKWHADHINPWIKGGKTIVENGQVLCIKCNLQKKDKLW
jgi:5-methylcytosine-specific restriction endonuclease McrA